MSDAPSAVTAVMRSCGLGVTALDELEGGASNMVFAARSASGEDFVVRATAAGSHRYVREMAAMDRVRGLGVPCPDVIAVATEADHEVMVARRCPGRRLADVADDLSGVELRGIAVACGELLATIHSVGVVGFGNLDEVGHGRWPTFDGWFVDDIANQVDEAAGRCSDAGILTDLHHLVRQLDASRAALQSCPSRLAHGDFSPMNLMVDGVRVTGLLDWESAKAGPPALDFGWWDWFAHAWSTPFPTAAMLPAYRAATDLDLSDLDELRRLVVLRVLAGHLVWSIRRGDPEAFERVRRVREAFGA